MQRSAPLRVPTALAGLLLAAALAAVLAPPRPALADGRIDGEPPQRGVALVSWSGGTVDAVAHAAAAGGGCALGSVRANGPSGGLVGYAFGAPHAANRAFLDRYAAGDLPAGTPLLLACAEPPVPGALRYNRRDTTGGATTAGSYAFLEDASDLTSGSGGFAWIQGYAEALLVHRTDAGGASRSGFYGEVEAGDAFTVWYAEGCWGHYEVTGVLADPPATAPRKLFAVEGVSDEYTNACRDAAGHFRVGADADIEFRWGPPPPLRMGSDGIPYMRQGQPLGSGTYRLSPTLVIDVPAGMRLIYVGWVLVSDGTVMVRLKDEESGSRLGLDGWSGEEHGRLIKASGASGASRDVGALFDAIVASATGL